MSAAASRPAVFLDRDGVLNRDRVDYVKSLDELVFLPEIGPAVRRLNEAGFAVILISNQAGVARGMISPQALDEITDAVAAHLAESGARLDDVFYCTHHPDDGCDCRKPLPGNLLRAAEKHGLDLCRSCFIGDSEKDVRAAHAVGCRAILVLSGNTIAYAPGEFAPERDPEHVADSLVGAVEWLLDRQGAEE